jgi:predicted metal-dependent phosphoesterase TrpH
MLKFARNKLVSIERTDKDILIAHGLLDDDIYSLAMDVSISLSNLEILAIEGKWNRWTTPECPRAIPFLQEALGFRIDEEGFSQKVHKIVGRKACRHHANLLLECCYSAKEAAMVLKWQDQRETEKDLTFEEFLAGVHKEPSPSMPVKPAASPKTPSQEEQQDEPPIVSRDIKGQVIDLHVHTSPASPCSSAPVDQLIEEAKRIGLHGICLTDHNYVWDPGRVDELREMHDFLVLRGNEITTDQGDIIVFGLDRDIKGIIKLEDLREEVLGAGGFMIVAHPFRGFLTFGVGQLGLTPEKAMERPLLKMIDAVEVMNGKVTQKENHFASEVAAGLGLPTTGGSDAHEVSEVGIYATRFLTQINNEADLINALKAGGYAPIAYRNAAGAV